MVLNDMKLLYSPDCVQHKEVKLLKESL